MELKDQIRIARGAAGMTQPDLASKLKVSKQTIIWWETGEHRPKTGRIRELETILNVRLDLSERGDATPLDSSKKSLSVDPECLRLAVAIGRLPLKQREAITTLALIGEKAALGHGTESFILLESDAEGGSIPSFVEKEKGAVHELQGGKTGTETTKPRSRKGAGKNAA